jgi:transglutaminase-like putative cysteine protease
MSVLTIHHRTIYRYSEPVQLGPHRLMLRPRESHNVRLVSSTLEIQPAAPISWTNDVFGNAVASVKFPELADHLVIDSAAVVELAASPWPVFDIAGSAIRYPFHYSSGESVDLGALLTPQYFDPGGALAEWAQGFVRGIQTDTLALLKDLVAGVAGQIRYQSREEEGTQSPQQTLERGWGSCRDFAVLFVEAARSLGFGARIISGYLYNPDHAAAVSNGPGSTHAWAEIYLPGAGWVTFDPTNRAVGGFNLVPVGVGRTIDQVMPVAGTFLGRTGVYQGMSVEVQVTS